MNNNQAIINFLTIRRSVTAKIMAPGSVDRKHLQKILEVGLRVPDHGALKPWRLVVIAGDARKRFDETIILTAFQKDNATITEEVKGIESSRMQRADVVIAVISKPIQHKNIQQWEMHLSAGAVCTTLLYAAQSYGYAAQWLTEWYAYNNKVLRALGGVPGEDRIAGFIFIGEKIKNPVERTRPNPELIVSYF
ncbi:nitroreductase [Candidatus Puniceispirillum sp.]|nr:nitroreductase [Candidatus Puniceispirillum sp.]